MKSTRTTRSFLIPIVLLIVIFMTQVVACTQSAIKNTPTIIPTLVTSPTPTLAPSPTPTLTPLPYFNMQIFPDQVRQTIRDVGAGNFIHRYGGVLSALDPVSQMNLDLLKPRFARVQMALNDWLPANPNTDPKITATPAYQDDGYNHATFQLLQVFKKQGIQITATVWDVPDWMVDNPTDTSGRVISHDKYPQVIDAIAAWLLIARDTYGVDVTYVSFNEANGGYNTLLSPEDMVALLRQAGPRFTELGLKTKWLLGDCYDMKHCLEYIQPIWADESIRPYLGALSYHSWDANSVSDNTITSLADFAASTGLEILCTETGWDAQLWQKPEEFPTFSNAFQLAGVYSRVLKLGRATTLAYWEMMGSDYSLSDGKTPYPALQVIQQLTEAIPPGSKIIATSPNAPAMDFVAAQTTDGIVLYVVNQSLAETFKIIGLPDGQYNLIQSTRDGMNQPGGTFTVTGGMALVKFLGFSISLITPQK